MPAGAQERPQTKAVKQTDDLTRLRDFLEERTGIFLPPEQLDRLQEFLHDPRHPPCASGEILEAMSAGSRWGKEYLNRLVAAVATNETYFFRILPHFQVLEKYVFPEIVSANNRRGKRSLKIWSAGCSSGEEPYSIAILLLERFPELREWEVSILGTDIDREALEKARQGVYGSWSFRGVEPGILRKYFHPASEGRYGIDERLRACVRFQPLNLKNDPYPFRGNGTSDLDLILCRNVIIYFRAETTKEILKRFYQCLNPGSFLLTGAGEYGRDLYRGFEVRVFPQAVVYQKPSEKCENQGAPLRSLKPLVARPLKAVAVEPSKARAPQTDATEEAISLIARGEIDQALLVLASAVEKQPDNPRPSFLLGELATNRGHFTEAEHWLKRVLELDPLYLDAQYLLALLWLEGEKTFDALRAFQRTIYLDPNFPMAHFYLARLYRETGQQEKATKCLLAVKNLIATLPPDHEIPGGEGMTAHQLLGLAEQEIKNNE